MFQCVVSLSSKCFQLGESVGLPKYLKNGSGSSAVVQLLCHFELIDTNELQSKHITCKQYCQQSQPLSQIIIFHITQLYGNYNCSNCNLCNLSIGPGRVNQLGGLYINGKPLPKEIRGEIIELARLGVRPCDISRRLKITHGCISKLLSKFQKTGSINPGGANVGRPRVITPKIEQKIEQYRREQPGIFSWELRDRLLHENICSRENLPSLSSISRLIKHKMMARAADNRQEYKTNEGNSRTMNNISSHSTDVILNHQVEEQTGFQSPEDQGTRVQKSLVALNLVKHKLRKFPSINFSPLCKRIRVCSSKRALKRMARWEKVNVAVLYHCTLF